MSSGGIPRFAKKLENKESSDNGKPGHSVVREGTPVPLIDKNNSEFDEFEDFDMVFPSYEEANETDTFMNFDNSDLDEDECTPNTSSVKRDTNQPKDQNTNTSGIALFQKKPQREQEKEERAKQVPFVPSHAWAKMTSATETTAPKVIPEPLKSSSISRSNKRDSPERLAHSYRDNSGTNTTVSAREDPLRNDEKNRDAITAVTPFSMKTLLPFNGKDRVNGLVSTLQDVAAAVTPQQETFPPLDSLDQSCDENLRVDKNGSPARCDQVPIISTTNEKKFKSSNNVEVLHKDFLSTLSQFDDRSKIFQKSLLETALYLDLTQGEFLLVESEMMGLTDQIDELNHAVDLLVRKCNAL